MDVVGVCAEFLERLSKRQWSPVSQHFIQFGATQRPLDQLAKEAKLLYREFRLEEWEILRIWPMTAAIAHGDVRLIFNGEIHQTDLRWVRIDENGTTATEWQPGHRSLPLYGPTHFLKPAAGYTCGQLADTKALSRATPLADGGFPATRDKRYIIKAEGPL